MSAPRVSIVTPSFMQRDYLRDALDSVRCQSGALSVEHIVCDGGSDDGTAELLATSGARWVSEPDSGQSEALNKGFAMAEGSILGWLNADDYYLRDALSLVCDYFDAHPDTDVLYADCLFVDARGALLRAKAEHPFSIQLLRHYGCFIPSTAAFFSRRLLDSGQLHVDETLHFVMDYELFMRLAHSGVRFRYLPRYIAGFRMHELNKSHDDVRRLAERRVVQRAFGMHAPDRSGYSVTDRLWRGAHAAFKAATGGLLRQASMASAVGDDTRWWSADDA